MDIEQASDFTSNSRATRRITDSFRAVAATVYTPGSLCKYASLDLQPYSDASGIVLTAAGAGQQLLACVVSEDWNGFDESKGYASGAALARGSQIVKGTLYGYHPAVLMDNTGAGSAACTNGALLFSAVTTAGKVQASASAATLVGAQVGNALLPASGIGSSLGAGAVTAASQTVTIAGTPAVNDVITVTLAVPYAGNLGNLLTPGVAQTRTISVTLATADAVSVTTAALKVLTAINADGILSTYYSAAQVAGVITITVKAAQFFVTNTTNTLGGFYITTSGTVGNSLTIATTAAGGSTSTAGASTFAAGAGYVGTVPALLQLM